MTLSRTRSIGVDPFFHLKRELLCDLHLVRTTSDEFFAREQPLAHFSEPVVDLAFIDGMHLAEYLLRDFINTERFTHAASVIVLDDMLPRHPDEAGRDRALGRVRGSWTGDVFKVGEALRGHRPDLVCLEVDTKPTGTVVVLLPDPSSRVLAHLCDDLVESYVVPDPQSVPDEVLRRTRAIDPRNLLDAPVWADLQRLREVPDAEARPAVSTLLSEAGLATSRH